MSVGGRVWRRGGLAPGVRGRGNEKKSENLNMFDECKLGVRAQCFTTNELKGKATTRNNQVCQLQVVTVYAQSSMCM